MIVNILTQKQEEIKIQKEKNKLIYIEILIKLDKILEYKITLLNIKASLINIRTSLINISNFITIIMIY